MRIILKINEDKTYESFSSLKKFFIKYPQYLPQKSNIETYLTRKKIAFSSDKFTLIRLILE